jgi:hypothetical protein
LLQAAGIAWYAMLAVGYCVLIPPGGGPDEYEHVEYVRSLAERWQLPALPGSALAAQPGRIQTSEAQHPPLYYLLMAPVYRLVGRPMLFYLVARLLGVLVGLAGLLMTRAAVRMSFPDRPAVTAFTMVIASGLGTYIYVMATVNNEVAAAAVVCAGWWVLAWGLHTRRATATVLLLGVLLGLAMLIKLTASVLIVVVGIAAVALSARQDGNCPLTTGDTSPSGQPAAIAEQDDPSVSDQEPETFCPTSCPANEDEHASLSDAVSRKGDQNEVSWPATGNRKVLPSRAVVAVRLAVIALLVAVVVAGWWPVRNLAVYDSAMPRSHVRPMFTKPSELLVMPEMWMSWLVVVVEESMWGMWVPWWLVRTTASPMTALIHADYAVLEALKVSHPEALAVPLAAVIVWLVGLQRAWQRGRLQVRQKWLLAAILGGMGWLLSGLWYQLLFVDGQVTYFIARYLPVMLPGMAVVMAVGVIELLPPRFLPAIGWLLQAFMVALGVHTWWLVTVVQVHVR